MTAPLLPPASIRLATTHDVAAMHRVRVAVRENRLSDPASIRPEHYRLMLERDGRGFVAEVVGEVAGFAIGDLARSNVWALFVDPDHEGRGLGRALHDALLAWMFASGATRVWLSTASGTRAERFYRRAGWTAVGTEASGEIRFEISRDAKAVSARPAAR